MEQGRVRIDDEEDHNIAAANQTTPFFSATKYEQDWKHGDLDNQVSRGSPPAFTSMTMPNGTSRSLCHLHYTLADL